MDSKSALNELNKYRSTAQNAGDIYKQQSQELGVGASQQRSQELRNLVTGTEQALRGVEASVTGRTQGSLVTEAQRARLANLERAPIADQFNVQQGALSNEQQTYQNLLAEAGNRSNLVYTSQQDRLRSLEGTYQSALEEEARRRAEALEREKLMQQQKQFEAQLNQQMAESNKRMYDIDKLIAEIMNKNKPEVKTANTVLPQAAIPNFTVDQSRGLNLNQAIGSGGLKTIPPKSSPNLLQQLGGLFSGATSSLGGLFR